MKNLFSQCINHYTQNRLQVQKEKTVMQLKSTTAELPQRCKASFLQVTFYFRCVWVIQFMYTYLKKKRKDKDKKL